MNTLSIGIDTLLVETEVKLKIISFTLSINVPYLLDFRLNLYFKNTNFLLLLVQVKLQNMQLTFPFDFLGIHHDINLLHELKTKVIITLAIIIMTVKNNIVVSSKL